MVELVLEADPAAPSPPLSPPSASLAFSLRLSRVVFLIGIATPVVLALVTAPAVTTPPLPPSEEKASQYCQILAPPELNLHYSCQRAGPECWSTYWWGLTLPLELPASADPPSPPLSVTVRAGAGSWAEARELETRLLSEHRLPCSVDASGAVRVLESSSNATALHLAGADGDRGGSDAMPLPLGMLLATAAWNALLDGFGIRPRPPPAWLLQGVWLRLCSPGVPLVTFSSFTHLVYRRGGPARASAAHAALLTPAMLAATAETASLLIGECRRSLGVRRMAKLSPLPVYLGLALIAAAGAALGRVMLEPAMAEVARCSETMNALRREAEAAAEAAEAAGAAPEAEGAWQHPLGPLRSRSLSRSNFSAIAAAAGGGEVEGPAARTRQQQTRRVCMDSD